MAARLTGNETLVVSINSFLFNKYRQGVDFSHFPGKKISRRVSFLNRGLLCLCLGGVLTPLMADPIGWGDAQLVERRVEEYNACCHEGEPRLYAVSASLKGPFIKDTETPVEIALSYTQEGRFQRRVIAEILLAPSAELFPVHPSVSALGDEILIAWQETLPQGGAAGIYYAYSATGPEGFTGKSALPVTAGKLNAILPLAKMTGPGRHIILYQEPSAANRFQLTAATGAGGVFTGTARIAEISGATRGALFPAVLRRGNRLDILYQNRAGSTLIDDIFRGFSVDQGLNWSADLRVTQNGFQNFSGRLTNTGEKLVFVWQSNPNKIWTIFAAPENAEPVQVSENTAPGFLPAIVGGGNTVVVAWQDTRAGIPQIYAKFIDRPENQYVGIDHRVTRDGIAARPLEFVRWGARPFLFYGCGPGLCVREADTTADAVRIVSRTHALGKISKSADAVFTWPNPGDISGVESYAYVVDDVADTDPDLFNLNARANQITIPGLNGGSYFMHIKYRDRAGNVSPVAHYPFVIDSVPPSRPIITSPTHENGIPDERQDVILKFSAADDSGIRLYRFAMGQKLPREFTDTTERGETAFNNVPPGNYVFGVEAIDLGGNVSERSYYRVEIGRNERNDLTIRHNAEADVISRPEILFTIQDNYNRGIKEVYFQSGFDTKDPFLGKRLIPEAYENIYLARIRDLQRGVSVISLGIVYADGTRAAPRHFNFDSNDPRAKKKFAFTDVEYEKAPVVRERDAIQVGGKADIISSKFARGILEIRLNYDATLACAGMRAGPKHPCSQTPKVRVKGYVWEVANVERIPQGELNFSGPVEFFYLPKPGRYFLNAKTLFKGPERQQFAFDTRGFEVPDVRREFRKNLFTGLGIVLAVLALLALWQRRRLAFYAGAWG
jgi:hypothetical protein